MAWNRSKYNNRKVQAFGEVFDSKHEMQRYCELKLLEESGQITDLKRQFKFVLIPTQYEAYERYGKKNQRLKDGKRLVEKECSYIADFVYRDDKGVLCVEDAKGFKTEAYIIKRKLMLQIYGIRIKEV